MPEINIEEPGVTVQEQPAQSRLTRLFKAVFPAEMLGVEHDTFLNRLIPWLHRGGLAVVDPPRAWPIERRTLCGRVLSDHEPVEAVVG